MNKTSASFTNSWAENVGDTEKIEVGINVSYDDNGDAIGAFGFSGPGFTCQGAPSVITNSQDESDNLLSVVNGNILYYPVVNGVKSSKGTRGAAVLTLSVLADGTQSEGLIITDLNNNVLFTTQGLWGVTRGSIKITL